MTHPTGHQRSRLQLIEKIPICEVCKTRCSACAGLKTCCLLTSRSIEAGEEVPAYDRPATVPTRQELEEEEEVAYG